MGLPNHLWNHCIELQDLIHSHTAHSNYELDVEVPETCITGQKADISNIYEYYCYKWVMFRDQPITYPDPPMILGRYLVPAIDVGSAMTYKILKAKGYYVCRTIVNSLKPIELACSEHKQSREDSDASVAEALGPAATIYDFNYKEYTDLTPDLDYYDDFDENSAIGIPDDYLSLPATSGVNGQ